MKNKSQLVRFCVSLFLSIDLPLVTSVAMLPRGIVAQASKENKQTCEELKRQIKDLQDGLAEESELIDKAQQSIARIESQINHINEFIRENPGLVSYGQLLGIGGAETYRGAILDLRAAQLRLKRAINDAKELIDAIEKQIADLQNKLSTCGSQPTTTTSPRLKPTPTPNPPENKNVGLLPGYHVDTNAANGLFVTTFDTPQGKIKVNLTDDVAAGDTISGTVETEPAGKNEAERAQNQAELNGYVVELEGQKTKVGDKKISCNIPGVLTTEAKTIVLQHNGQPVATTEIPISVTTPLTPTQATLPTGGQQGRPIECHGNFAPTDQIKIGRTIMPLIAGSPRKLVVNNTSEVVGPTTIECSEHGAVSQCPFRNINIKLSAPKLSLRRGETTALHVVVMGLAGITQDVPLDLVDTTPSVIKMSGGDAQRKMIQPGQVQPDGTAAFDFTLTGIMAGGFGVTGTVRWSDVCHPMNR